MHREVAVGLGFALFLVACSGAGSSSERASTSAPRTGTTSSAPATTTTTFRRVPPTTVSMTTINPCTLFTQQDASRLVGKALTRAPGGDLGSGTCAYSGGEVLIGAELTVKVDASSQAAHAEFPTWVVASPTTAPGFTVTTLSNVADEAKTTYTGFSDGIYFRRGPVLVKIGVYPPVSATALKTAAFSAIARL